MTELSSFLSQEDYAAVLSKFLKDVNFTMPLTKPDFSLEEPVISHFKSKPWEPYLVEKAIKKSKWTSTGLGMVYPYAEKGDKVIYGIFCTYMFLIDDSDKQLDEEIQDFETNLIQGRPQTSPFLCSLLEFVDEMSGHFGPYSRTMISKSLVEFVCGRIIENRYNDTLKPTMGALNFPYYLRQKTGIAEPMAHFVFPESLYPEKECLATFILVLPDLCDFVSFVNDIFSFYKESILSDERINYIWNFATVYNVSISESLKETCDRAMNSVSNIRTVLSQHQTMSSTTEQFLQAYIAWYLTQARYRLSDIRLDC